MKRKVIVVTDIGAVDTHSPKMEALGYEVMGEYGIPGRRYFRKSDDAGMRTHPAHTFAVGSEDIESYMDGKDAFIKEVDRRAAAWRSEVGE